MSQVLLEVKNLNKVVKTDKKVVPIFKDITFHLKKGEILAIVGQSGVGKTELLRTLVGLDTPTSGTILFRVKRRDNKRDLISLVFEDYNLVPWLTVEENITICLDHLHLSEGEKKERVRKYLELLGAGGYEDAYPGELPRGLRRKVSIARTLAVEPIILLMDEPFSNLDFLSAMALKDEFLRLWRGKEFPSEGILFTTTSVEEAVYMADRIFVMVEGEDGYSRFKKEYYIKKFIKEKPLEKDSKAYQKLIDRIYSDMVEG